MIIWKISLIEQTITSQLVSIECTEKNDSYWKNGYCNSTHSKIKKNEKAGFAENWSSVHSWFYKHSDAVSSLEAYDEKY